MKFHKGSSGSPKHTESMGDGSGMGGGMRGPSGIAIGPGKAAGRVKSEIMRQVSDSDGRGADRNPPKGMKTYAEGSKP